LWVGFGGEGSEIFFEVDDWEYDGWVYWQFALMVTPKIVFRRNHLGKLDSLPVLVLWCGVLVSGCVFGGFLGVLGWVEGFG
jgi:hypothetical protein